MLVDGSRASILNRSWASSIGDRVLRLAYLGPTPTRYSKDTKDRQEPIPCPQLLWGSAT